MKKQLLVFALIASVSHTQGAETPQCEKPLSIKQAAKAYKEGYRAAKLNEKARNEKLVRELASMMMQGVFFKAEPTQPVHEEMQEHAKIMRETEQLIREKLLVAEMKLAEEVIQEELEDLYQ